MTTIGATCEVHLMLRGMVDAEKEVARLEEKIQKLDGQVDKLKKTMSIEGYEDKVCCALGHNPRQHLFCTTVLILMERMIQSNLRN